MVQFKRLNALCYYSLIHSFASAGDLATALTWFQQMKLTIGPNKSTYDLVVRLCAARKENKQAVLFLEEMKEATDSNGFPLKPNPRTFAPIFLGIRRELSPKVNY
jgi:pentatricopeptide repeat protein